MKIQLNNLQDAERIAKSGNASAVFQATILDGDYSGSEVTIAITHNYLRRQGLIDHIDELAETQCVVHTARPYTDMNQEDVDPDENVERVASGDWGLTTLNSRDIDKVEKTEAFRHIMTDFKASKGAKVVVENDKQRRVNASLKKGSIVRRAKTVDIEHDEDNNTDNGGADLS